MTLKFLGPSFFRGLLVNAKAASDNYVTGRFSRYFIVTRYSRIQLSI